MSDPIEILRAALQEIRATHPSLGADTAVGRLAAAAEAVLPPTPEAAFLKDFPLPWRVVSAEDMDPAPGDVHAHNGNRVCVSSGSVDDADHAEAFADFIVRAVNTLARAEGLLPPGDGE